MSLVPRTHTLPFVTGVFLVGVVLAGINQLNEKWSQQMPAGSNDTLAPHAAEQSSVLSEPQAERLSLPSSPENVTTFEELRDVVNTVGRSQREEISHFVDRFDTLSVDNVYLTTLYKAAIEKLMMLDFTETLDEVLFKVANVNDTAGTHSDYWNRLALQTLAEQEYDLVHQSFALVSALFDPSQLQGVVINSTSAETESEPDLNGSISSNLAAGTSSSIASEPGTNEYNELALADLQTALHFIQSEVVDEENKEVLIIDALYDWSERKSDSALQDLANVIDSNLELGEVATFELGQLYATEKYRQSPLEAFEWLRNHNNEALSSTTLDHVLVPWIQDSPDDAYSYLSQLDFTSGAGTPADNSQLELAEDIVLAFVLNDNEQTAAEWLNLQTNQEIIQRGQDLLTRLTTEQ